MALVAATARGADPATAPKENVFATQPLGIRVSIKMIGPYTQAADLQIICLFKHKSTGDTYQGAAKATDEHLGGMLSALRNRGEYVGELGETFLFTPPVGSIPARQFMVIGLGEEKDLSLDSLRLEQLLSAYDTEKRLQAQGLAPAFDLEDVVIEAGPSYFDSAVKQVGEGIEFSATQLSSRNSTPYYLTPNK